MTQKVLKVGASAAVTIPKKSLEELGLKVGDKVTVSIDGRKRMVVITPATDVADREVHTWTKKFIERYRPALEAHAPLTENEEVIY